MTPIQHRRELSNALLVRSTSNYALRRYRHPQIRGFYECLRIADGFYLVRNKYALSCPLYFEPFETLGYIGLCYCFGAASGRRLAFPHLFCDQMNVSSGYAFGGGTDYLLHTPLYYIALRFDPDYFDRLAAEQPLPAWLENLRHTQGQCVHVNVPPRLRMQAWKACLLPPGETHAGRLRLESFALVWLADLLDWTPAAAAPSRIDAVVDILHSEYRKTLTIAGLARRSGLNECYLKQQFKAYTGQNIAAYLNALRLQSAKRLLRERRDLSIAEIALLSGRQPKYFSTWFARHEGVSPLVWRATSP